jgi:hypothetical protein
MTFPIKTLEQMLKYRALTRRFLAIFVDVSIFLPIILFFSLSDVNTGDISEEGLALIEDLTYFPFLRHTLF